MELPEKGIVDLPLRFYQKKSEEIPPSQKSTEEVDFEISPDTARGLFEEGAFLIFLDVPERTEFGVDCSSWNVGEKFKGLKMIPPGIHFIYYSAVSKDNVTSLRTGFFHNFKNREILVKKWDKLREGLSDEPVSEVEKQRLESNLQNLDQFLGPYPYKDYKKWISLSRFSTEKSLVRLSPTNFHQSIYSVQQLESNPFSSSRTNHPPAKRPKPDDELPEMRIVENTRIRFASMGMPLRTASLGLSASEITRLNMDKSDLLDKLILNSFDNDEKEVLGEISFAFICFLIGQVFDAFEQWKKLIDLMCSCERAIVERPDLYKQFISMLYYQLKEVPRDFFVDIVTRENFLTNTLQRFFASVENLDAVDGELRKKAVEFRKYLQRYFKWDFTTELWDDAPVVVEL